MTAFLRLLEEGDKNKALRGRARSVRNGRQDEQVFDVAPSRFEQVPGSPFAYWIGDKIRQIFRECSPLESEGRRVNFGAATKDDFRFLRLGWEFDTESKVNEKWKPFSKGGVFAAYYSDIHLVVNWQVDADEIEASLLKKYPYLGETANWVLHRECDYLSPGITWTYATTLPFSARALPSGCIFGHGGPSVTNPECDDQSLLCDLAILNSSAFRFLVSLRVGLAAEGRKNYDIGVIQLTPIPSTDEKSKSQCALLASRGWALGRLLDSVNETSHAFLLPVALRDQAAEYDRRVIDAELKKIQAEINDIVFRLYGLDESDRKAIVGSSSSASSGDAGAQADMDDQEQNWESTDSNISLLSWCVGVAFGRFDWRLATGEREVPPEPEPFDSHPTKSPGMLADGDEPFHQHAGILVDDPGHLHDLARLIESVLERVDVPVPTDVRRWLQRDFFKEHLSQYSKSRRKAPIYWPLSTLSGNYTLWVYYPSLTSQTVYSAVNDFLEPKLREVADNAQALRGKTDRNTNEEKEFGQLQDLEMELKELRETILGIAKDYVPNHDDGVQITAAPLWPLFQHKPWQKILKDTWNKLEKGDYDWAHLAMNYWPERVREKCKTDKSIAIAHGLEELHES